MPLLPEGTYRKTRGIIRLGTRANQPAATTVLEGTLYYVTDQHVTERSNGTVWESYSDIPLVNNNNGIPGIDGMDGDESFIHGPQGIIGPQGIQGIQGFPGFDGLDADELQWLIDNSLRNGGLTDLSNLAQLDKQNTFSNTSGQIIQGPLDISGASAGQIKFPATENASSNANTLDDYEEGTWTPTIGGITSESGQSYDDRVGTYVKIGKQVHLEFRAVLTNKGTITGDLAIKGIPFNTGDQSPSGVCGFFAMTTTWTAVYMVALGASRLDLYGTQAGATSMAALGSPDISNTTTLTGSINYDTNG